MSVRDRGLAPYAGPRRSSGGRWLVVARRTLVQAWRARATWWFKLLAAMLLAAWAIGMAVVVKTGGTMPTGLGGGAAPAGSASPEWHLYHWTTNFWAGGPLLALLVALSAGAGAIADDRRAGTLPFYLVRSVTLDGYLAGKLLPVALLAAAAVAAPGIVFVLESFSLGGGEEPLRHLAMLGRVALVALCGGAAIAAPTVALSAIARQRGGAQAAAAAMIIVPSIAGAIAANVSRAPWGRLLSIPAQLDSVGAWAFGVALDEAGRPLPVWAAAAMLAAITAGSIAWLRLRLRVLAEDGS